MQTRDSLTCVFKSMILKWPSRPVGLFLKELIIDDVHVYIRKQK